MISGPASAKAIHRVVGFVGKEAISHEDVLQRLRLMMVSSDQPVTPQAVAEFYAPVLQGLIDEALQRKASAKAGIKIDPQEIAQKILEIEAQSGLKQGQMAKIFAHQNVSLQTIEKQTESVLMWTKYIEQKYGFRTSISPQEVEKAKKKWLEERSHPLYQLAEIVLYPSSTMSYDQVWHQAQELKRMIEAGAPFPQLAAQFSQSPSKERGGILEWGSLTKIDPELHTWVQKAEIGSIQGPLALPLKAPKKVIIVALLGRKNPGELRAHMPTDDQFQAMLRGEALSLWARKELEALRKNTHYEIRLPQDILPKK